MYPTNHALELIHNAPLSRFQSSQCPIPNATSFTQPRRTHTMHTNLATITQHTQQFKQGLSYAEVYPRLKTSLLSFLVHWGSCRFLIIILHIVNFNAALSVAMFILVYAKTFKQTIRSNCLEKCWFLTHTFWPLLELRVQNPKSLKKNWSFSWIKCCAKSLSNIKSGRQTQSRPPRVTVALICTAGGREAEGAASSRSFS